MRIFLFFSLFFLRLYGQGGPYTECAPELVVLSHPAPNLSILRYEEPDESLRLLSERDDQSSQTFLLSSATGVDQKSDIAMTRVLAKPPCRRDKKYYGYEIPHTSTGLQSEWDFDFESFGSLFQDQGSVTTEAQLLKLVSRLNIGHFLVKPGHRIVRSREQVMNMTALLQSERSDGIFSDLRKPFDISHSFEGEIVINLLTSEKGRPIRVEALEGHHRLFAFYLAGYHTVEALVKASREGSIHFLLNGKNLKSGEFLQLNKFPVHGTPMSLLGDVFYHRTAKAPTFKTPFNNWQAGSRTTLRQACLLTQAVFYEQPQHMPLIGVMFYDRETDVEKLLRGYPNDSKFQHIVLVPTFEALPGELRNMAKTIRSFTHWNLYVGPLTRELRWPDPSAYYEKERAAHTATNRLETEASLREFENKWIQELNQGNQTGRLPKSLKIFKEIMRMRVQNLYSTYRVEVLSP